MCVNRQGNLGPKGPPGPAGANTCQHKRFDGRQCEGEIGHPKIVYASDFPRDGHLYYDECQHCGFKISAPCFWCDQICPNCGKAGR
jgi:hypothetical protein